MSVSVGGVKNSRADVHLHCALRAGPFPRIRLVGADGLCGRGEALVLFSLLAGQVPELLGMVL